MGCLNLYVQVSLKVNNNIFFAPRSVADSTLLSLSFTFHSTSAFFRSASDALESMMLSHAVSLQICDNVDPPVIAFFHWGLDLDRAFQIRLHHDL